MTTARPSLLRHPDFPKLWSAETISQFGTQVSLLAIPLVALTLLQATPIEVGLLGTMVGSLFAFLPLLIGPLRHLREMPQPLEEPVTSAA